MSRATAIRGYGYFDGSGFGGSGRENSAEAQTLDEMKWRDVSDEPFKRFGQLDAMSKCAMVALEMVGMDACVNARIRDEMAIIIGTQEGCLGTDIDFSNGIDSEKGPSPRLFAYTLPSTVCGDIAIRYGLHGPNACFQAGRDSGLVALREGHHLMQSGEAEACVCVGCNALFRSSAETAKTKSLLDGDGDPSAYVVVLARCEAPLGEEARVAEEVTSLRALRDFIVRDGEKGRSLATLDDRDGKLMFTRYSEIVSG